MQLKRISASGSEKFGEAQKLIHLKPVELTYPPNKNLLLASLLSSGEGLCLIGWITNPRDALGEKIQKKRCHRDRSDVSEGRRRVRTEEWKVRRGVRF